MSDLGTCEVEGCDRPAVQVVQDRVRRHTPHGWVEHNDGDPHRFCRRHERDSQVRRASPDSSWTSDDTDRQHELPF